MQAKKKTKRASPKGVPTWTIDGPVTTVICERTAAAVVTIINGLHALGPNEKLRITATSHSRREIAALPEGDLY